MIVPMSTNAVPKSQMAEGEFLIKARFKAPRVDSVSVKRKLCKQKF